MPRNPDGLYPRTVRITFRIDGAEEELLDSIRGTTSRSTFIRNLIAAEGHRHRRRSKPTTEGTPE